MQKIAVAPKCSKTLASDLLQKKFYCDGEKPRKPFKPRTYLCIVRSMVL